MLDIIKMALTVSVTGLVLAQGLQVSPAELLAVRRRPGLLLRAVLAGYVLVPLATLIIVLLVRPARNVEVGLALLAAAPVAPLMVVRIPRSGGGLADVVALHLAMTLFALAATPIVLSVMKTALAFEARLNYPSIAWLIARVVVLPVCIGVAIHAWRPALARQWAEWLSRSFWALFATVAVVLLVLGAGTLSRVDVRSYLAMGLCVAAAFLIGHAVAPRGPAERLTMAMITAARHPGVVLLVAVASVPAADALAVLIPYLIVFLIASTAYVRWTTAPPPAPTRMPPGEDARPFAHPQLLGVKP